MYMRANKNDFKNFPWKSIVFSAKISLRDIEILRNSSAYRTVSKKTVIEKKIRSLEYMNFFRGKSHSKSRFSAMKKNHLLGGMSLQKNMDKCLFS